MSAHGNRVMPETGCAIAARHADRPILTWPRGVITRTVQDAFPDPYWLELRRSPNPRTTFGRCGPHGRLGERLARLELRVLVRELPLVLPRLEPDGEPVRIRSNFTNGLKRFPVRVT